MRASFLPESDPIGRSSPPWLLAALANMCHMAFAAGSRSLLALALLPLSAGQGVAPLLKAIEGNNPSQINMALKSTHPKLLKEVDGSGASPRRKGRHARSRQHGRMRPSSFRHEPVVALGLPLSWRLAPYSLQQPISACNLVAHGARAPTTQA